MTHPLLEDPERSRKSPSPQFLGSEFILMGGPAYLSLQQPPPASISSSTISHPALLWSRQHHCSRLLLFSGLLQPCQIRYHPDWEPCGKIQLQLSLLLRISLPPLLLPLIEARLLLSLMLAITAAILLLPPLFSSLGSFFRLFTISAAHPLLFKVHRSAWPSIFHNLLSIHQQIILYSSSARIICFTGPMELVLLNGQLFFLSLSYLFSFSSPLALLSTYSEHHLIPFWNKLSLILLFLLVQLLIYRACLPGLATAQATSLQGLLILRSIRTCLPGLATASSTQVEQCSTQVEQCSAYAEQCWSQDQLLNILRSIACCSQDQQILQLPRRVQGRVPSLLRQFPTLIYAKHQSVIRNKEQLPLLLQTRHHSSTRRSEQFPAGRRTKSGSMSTIDPKIRMKGDLSFLIISLF